MTTTKQPDSRGESEQRIASQRSPTGISSLRNSQGFAHLSRPGIYYQTIRYVSLEPVLDEPVFDEVAPTTHVPPVPGYIRSIIALAKADVDTSVGSSINLAKS